VLAYVFIGATYFQAIRCPYFGITQAAGHFKPMRNAAFIEVAINIIISVALVFKFGIVGVVIGTLFAYLYRTIRYERYLSRNIIPRGVMAFIKRVILSLFCILIIAVIPYVIPLLNAKNIFEWVSNAAFISTIALVLTVVVELLFYRSDLTELVKMSKGVFKKRASSSDS